MQPRPVAVVLLFQSKLLTKVAFEKHCQGIIAGQTVIDSLALNCPELSRQKLKQALQYGAVWLTRGTRTTRVRRAKRVLQNGDELHFYYDEEILTNKIKSALLVADEGEYSVWNKPCGMFSQGTKWGDHSSICRWIELFGFKENLLDEREVFLVHRLDRATSGLILVAHSKKIAAKFSAIFEKRQIEKHYRAKVSGLFPSENKYRLLTAQIDERPAMTRVINVEYDSKSDTSELLLSIETGRKHQIRKHLSDVGYSVIGDRLYAKSISDVDKAVKNIPDLQLQSCYLKFLCPSSEQIKIYQI